MQSRITMSQETKKRTPRKETEHFIKYSVAADISKDTFNACISALCQGQRVKVIATRKFNNTPNGFEAFESWQRTKCKLLIPVVFVMEATGIYHERLAWFLHKADCHVSVVLPNKAKAYMKCLGIKSKTDKIDANGLARMAAEQNLAPWVAPKKVTMELRDISRYRESLQESRTRFNNQLQAHRCAEFVSEIEERGLLELIALLDKQIKETEKMIIEKLKSDPDIKEGIDRLVAIKGVSIITAATIIAETNCFEEFNNQRQLTSYAGYDVVENQSGKHVGKTKISKKGNAHIRRILHMAALNVVAYDEPVFVNLYNRVYDRTKIKMKGYVAVQRKLLCLIYTLWKKKVSYEKEYYKNDEHPAMQSRMPSFCMAS